MRLDQVIAGVAVVLAVEGLLYAIAPDAVRRALGRLAALPPEQLRVGGLMAAALGIGTAWLLVR